jgi:hypothetical protein
MARPASAVAQVIAAPHARSTIVTDSGHPTSIARLVRS